MTRTRIRRKLSRRTRVSPALALWLLAFLTFSLGGVVWALLTPPLGVADEGMHTIKAAGVWLGDFSGETTRVEVAFSDLASVPACYQFQPAVSADCAPDLGRGREVVDAATTAGSYPPLFYALVGWWTLLTPAAPAIYLMRIVHVLLCSALLASALRVASTSGWWMISALTLSITPVALYHAAGVNPTGLEIAAAVAFWVALLAVIRPSVTREALLLAAVAGFVLANVRPLSPLFVLLILGCCLALAGRQRCRDLARSVGARLVGASLAVGLVLSSLWILVNDTLDSFVGTPPAPMGTGEILRTSFGQTMFRIEQMVGIVGYLDTRPFSIVYVTWYVALGSLITLTIALGTTVQRFVLGGLLIGVLFLPLALEVRSAREIGFVYQGRYGLPLAAGVPLVCGYVLSASSSLVGIARRTATFVMVGASVGHLLTFYSAMRRYSVGVSDTSPIWFLGRERWSPPVPVLPLGCAAVVFSLLLIVVGRVAGERTSVIPS